MSDDTYRPIDCGVHDVLESSAVRRVPCRVRWTEGETTHDVVTTIDDIFVRDGAEYAVLGDGSTVRLDRIVELQPE